jgi:hypothetical protein
METAAKTQAPATILDNSFIVPLLKPPNFDLADVKHHTPRSGFSGMLFFLRPSGGGLKAYRKKRAFQRIEM